MGKITVVKDRNYTCISNAIFKDKRLSLKGVGLLVTMLSLPDNWDYTIAGLTAIVKDGKSAVRSTLKELEECGYLVREVVREESGRFADLDYIVYETPISRKPDVEEPKSEKRNPVNRTQVNTNKLNTNKQNNKKEKNNSCPSDNNTDFDDQILQDAKNIIESNCDDVEIKRNVYAAIAYYLESYYKHRGYHHPMISHSALMKIIVFMLFPSDEDNFDTDSVLYGNGYLDMIDRHFITNYGKPVDYNLCHFVTNGIILYQARNCGYMDGFDSKQI